MLIREENCMLDVDQDCASLPRTNRIPKKEYQMISERIKKRSKCILPKAYTTAHTNKPWSLPQCRRHLSCTLFRGHIEHRTSKSYRFHIQVVDIVSNSIPFDIHLHRYYIPCNPFTIACDTQNIQTLVSSSISPRPLSSSRSPAVSMLFSLRVVVGRAVDTTPRAATAA